MSDVEEPPTKMSKYEEYLEDGEDLEEGQEEWLSEGVLTDDDYNISTAAQQDNDTTTEQKLQAHQDGEHLLEEMVLESIEQGNEDKEKTDQNIEDTLNNLDSKSGLTEEMDTFLIKKTEDKSAIIEQEEKEKQKEDDDGNDTDDLLRLLEDDQQVKKKAIKIIKSEKTEDQGSSDDDEYIYERSKVKTLKVAKNALMKRVPTKAVQEQMSDTDDESSSDDATVKRMFNVKNSANKSSVKSHDTPRRVVKHVVQVNSNYYKSKPPQKTASKQAPKIKTEFKPRSADVKPPASFKPSEKNAIKKAEGEERNVKHELDEIIDEEEFLEEDDFELDEEEFGEESEGEVSKKQRIMTPEMMDEEVPSDEDSHSEDGSLYDELPSSDSEDFDDWFTLDVRSERAADYLPLLGNCARALLSAERRRCAARVSTLRQSLSALTDSARRQADSLRHAAMALAELDDTLRAA